MLLNTFVFLSGLCGLVYQLLYVRVGLMLSPLPQPTYLAIVGTFILLGCLGSPM